MEKTVFTFQENATIKTSIKDVLNTCLTSLDGFLKRSIEDLPDSINLIIDKIISQFGNIEEKEISIDSDYPLLKKYPKLFKKSINMVLSLINYEKYNQYPIEEQIEVEVSDLLRTYGQFEYYYSSSLIAIMSREEAIKYIETQEAKKVISRRDSSNYFNTLEDLVKYLKTTIDFWQTQEAIAEVINGAKMAFKIKKCRWADLLKDLDSGFGYAMLCSTDFEQAKNYNIAYRLTRKKTLMEGDEYCDFCYHDTRENKDLTHPSEIFWNNFE